MATDADMPLSQQETAEVAAPGVLQDGTCVGPYQVGSVIGRGGMGVIYRATATAAAPLPVGSVVALKVLRSDVFDGNDLRRFEREAAYLQALRHPGIVRVHDFGEDAGRPYLAMELVDGLTLDRHLRRHGRDTSDSHPRLAEKDVCDIVGQTLEALHAAHLASILHRDIKPGNVMLESNGRARLLDFGMARKQNANDESQITLSGYVVGTPAYMSPEQAMGARQLVSPRSDIYSIGAMCYELLTGRQPFVADSPMAVLRLVIDNQLTPPRHHNPQISHDLETVILTAMAKDPRDRYASAEDMAADLRLVSNGQPILARRISLLKRSLRILHRHRRAAAMLGLIVFILVAFGLLAARSLNRTITASNEALEEARAEVAAVEDRMTSGWHEQRRVIGRVPLVPANPEASEDEPDTIYHVPGVTGDHLRLRATVDTLPVGANAEFIISCKAPRRDQDNDAVVNLDSGYRLRFTRVPLGYEITLTRPTLAQLQRSGVTMASTSLTHNGPLAFMLTRDNDTLTVHVGEDVVLHALDLAPLTGGRNAIRSDHPDTKVLDLIIDRQVPSALISRLDAIDLVLTYAGATQARLLLQQFIRDFPESDEIDAANYRIGLCHLASADWHRSQADKAKRTNRDKDEKRHRSGLANSLKQAHDTFTALADSTDSDRYRNDAIFRSWTISLQLKDYARSDQLLREIREHIGIEQILASVPGHTLNGVPMQYIKRAWSSAAKDLEHAIDQMTTAAEVAVFLGSWAEAANAWIGLGQLQVANDTLDQAIDSFRLAAEHPQVPQDMRLNAKLKIAETERLRGNYNSAISLFQQALDSEFVEFNQWARLWYGELLLDLGRPESAFEIWSGNKHNKRSVPGHIMHHL
ncbi:MAG: protein kinase domain-containing protein, partial [Planctomycetota bacterium]